jgi:mandelate racemase
MSGSSQPAIAALRVRAARVPMPEPHQTASGAVVESPLVLTDVVTDAGVTGHSIVFTYTAAALAPTAEFLRSLAPLVVGERLAPLDLENKLSRRFRLLGTQGLVGMALAGLDMAVWDALARTSGLSLVALLGGAPRPIRAYGAIGYDGAKRCAEVASEWVRRGFTGVKAKIGYPSVREDVEVIRAIRSAAGDGVAIMVDYNQSLTPLEAVQRIRVLEDEGLEWVEEPTMAHDFDGHARIARESRTAIQCGENWWGPLDVQHAVDAAASDYVMLDAMKIGGVTGWTRAAAMLAPRGIRVSSHLWPELSAQLLAVTPTAHWLEYADWWNVVLKEPLQIADGVAQEYGTRAGSGLEWNEAALAPLLI